MDNIFEKAKTQFKNREYEEALKNFEKIKKDNKNYYHAKAYILACLFNLNKYQQALNELNALIEKDPYNIFLWIEKAKCHIFEDEYEKAHHALIEIERLIDVNDKEMLVEVSKVCSLLRDNEKALKYCDMALKLDENYKKALYEKSLIAVGLDDVEMMNEIADKLLEFSNEELISVMPVFILRFFSKNYRGCVDLINNFSHNEKYKSHIQMLKEGFYDKLCEDLNAQILCNNPVDITIDEAIKIMMDFVENEKTHGNIHGVEYFIL